MRTLLLLILAVASCAPPLTYGHVPMGTPNSQCEGLDARYVHDYGAPATGNLLAQPKDGGAVCGPIYLDPLGPPVFSLSGDGHREYAVGGAWILVESGTGQPTPGGAGTLYCYGEAGHHAPYGPSTVTDLALGAGASYVVGADLDDTTGGLEGCGDFETDEVATCVGTCTVAFGPGLDGAYFVFVDGTQGHVTWW